MKKTDLKLIQTLKMFGLLIQLMALQIFLHGIPHFAISIALKSNNEIISGLIYDPIKDEMFYAEKNSGAFFNNQRIKVSKKKGNRKLFVCNWRKRKKLYQTS